MDPYLLVMVIVTIILIVSVLILCIAVVVQAWLESRREDACGEQQDVERRGGDVNDEQSA